MSARPSFEIWEIDNDGRNPRVKSERIQVIRVAVRDQKGRFAGTVVDL